MKIYKKPLLLCACCLLAAMVCACAAQVETAPPVPPAEGISYPVDIPLLVEPESIVVPTTLTENPIIILYDSQPLPGLAEAYLNAYGTALLEASAREPQSTYAIEGFKLLAQPRLTHVVSADKTPFAFVCEVCFSVKPLHYESTLWWAGNNPPGEGLGGEEGWLDTALYLELSLDEQGNLRFWDMGTGFGFLTNAYIPLDFIRQAQEVYDWFELDLYCLTASYAHRDDPVPFEDVRVEYQGNVYRPARFDTLNELEAHLRQYFSAEITAELLASPYLAEIDGRLHVVDAARGAHIGYQGERWFIVEEEENRRVYEVEVDYLFPEEPEENGWTESFMYVFEFDNEHEWVFTYFDYYL